MTETLSRILGDHGMLGLYPLEEKSESVSVKIENLVPVSYPRKFKISPCEHGLDEKVKRIWQSEKIEASAFIAYCSPESQGYGSYIQFYNIKE